MFLRKLIIKGENMKENIINKKKYNSKLLIRINNDTKEKLLEVATFCGMPDLSSFVRKMIDNTIQKYEETKGE